LVFVEFSDAVLVRAIRSYTDNHVGALNFVQGDCITVRERSLEKIFSVKIFDFRFLIGMHLVNGVVLFYKKILQLGPVIFPVHMFN
jgi:hypothetical protein